MSHGSMSERAKARMVRHLACGLEHIWRASQSRPGSIVRVQSTAHSDAGQSQGIVALGCDAPANASILCDIEGLTEEWVLVHEGNGLAVLIGQHRKRGMASPSRSAVAQVRSPIPTIGH
jgi:hypothetical protein